MTIKEALEQDRPIVAVWDESPPKDEWLGIYAVANDGPPVLMAHEKMSKAEREARTVELRARGVRIGSATRGPAIWVVGDNFEIWSDDGKHSYATRRSVQVADRSIAVDSIVNVTTFVDDTRCHRGVRLELRDGPPVVLSEERDITPELDPTYGWDMLAVDAFWASLLGARLATWLGVSHVSQF